MSTTHETTMIERLRRLEGQVHGRYWERAREIRELIDVSGRELGGHLR